MSGGEAAPGVGALHFWVTVISRGQQETAVLGFLSLGGAGELPPEWWQLSMSAIRSGRLWSDEFRWVADAPTIC